MSNAEQYARTLTTMVVPLCMYQDFRHWLKRHGWLVISYDYLHDRYLLGSIKPLYAGQEVQAMFYAEYKAGVKFTGYVIS